MNTIERLALQAGFKYLQSHPEQIEAVVDKLAELLFGKLAAAIESKIAGAK